MNKPRRFAQAPRRMYPLSNVPAASEFFNSMETIKKLLSDIGDAKRGATPFNPKKLTETSKDEFFYGPFAAGLGGAVAIGAQMSQYLEKIPAFISNPLKQIGLTLIILGALQSIKNPIRGFIGKLNIDDFQKLMKERIVFTYSAGGVQRFDVGTFEDYIKNPSLLPKAVSRTLSQGQSYDESLVALTPKSAENLEKIAVIVENVDRTTMAALFAAGGLVISNGAVNRLIELSKGRDPENPNTRIKSQKDLVERARSIQKKNN